MHIHYQKIQEIFDTLKDATIDLFSGYHQISMFIDDQEVTSFTSEYGNYYFKLMPFGLTNVPATIQRKMNRIFFDNYVLISAYKSPVNRN